MNVAWYKDWKQTGNGGKQLWETGTKICLLSEEVDVHKHNVQVKVKNSPLPKLKY